MPQRLSKAAINKKRIEEQEAKSKAAKLERERNKGLGLSRGNVDAKLHSKALERVTPNYDPKAKRLPSKPDTALVITSRKVLNEEEQAREEIARREIERKKKQVGVLYNKGAYQFISPGMDLTTLGKK